MTTTLVQQVRAIQASMLESGRGHLLEVELDDLRCLIRLAVEFYHYLGGVKFESLDYDEVRYVSESIFSGVDSFCTLTSAYRSFGHATQSSVDWNALACASIKDQFIALYGKFTFETDFAKRCRLLLDLFKLQILFAGAYYD